MSISACNSSCKVQKLNISHIKTQSTRLLSDNSLFFPSWGVFQFSFLCFTKVIPTIINCSSLSVIRCRCMSVSVQRQNLGESHWHAMSCDTKCPDCPMVALFGLPNHDARGICDCKLSSKDVNKKSVVQLCFPILLSIPYLCDLTIWTIDGYHLSMLWMDGDNIINAYLTCT